MFSKDQWSLEGQKVLAEATKLDSISGERLELRRSHVPVPASVADSQGWVILGSPLNLSELSFFPAE